MTPIGCRMDALTPADRRRRAEVLGVLEGRVTSVEDLPEGLALELRNEADTAALAGEFVGYEARCCPFLRFDLSVEDEGGPIRLAMSGREGVGDFLRATFGALRPRPA
jgi:hypothetical protein